MPRNSWLVPVVVASAALVLASCAEEGPPIGSPTPTGSTADGGGSASSGGSASGPATGSATGSTTTTDSATTTTDAAAEPMTLTIGAAGDLLSHAPVIANANKNAGGGEGDYDFAPMFTLVEPLLSSPDLTICHMETPLSPDNTNLTVPRVLVFNTPHQLADALVQVGYDGCDFASNHTWDRGLQGLEDTEKVIKDAGLQYAGPTAHKSEAGDPAIYDVGDAGGITVAQLAYSYTLLNEGAPNTHVPDGAPWLKDYLWLGVGADGILADAKKAKDNGADFVVVSMHWGNEYVTEPTEQQRDIAKQLLESDDVDLILGTHVHVIQPCEKINDKYVLYGMGNFLSNQSPDTTNGGLRKATQEGIVAHVTLTKDADGKVTETMTYQPTRVDLDGHVITPANEDNLPETYERVNDTLHSLGKGSCDAKPMN